MYLCENGIYQKIFNELLNKGYDLKKTDLSYCFTGQEYPAKKGEKLVMWIQKGKRSNHKHFIIEPIPKL
jgi:hypothetical protein